MRAGVLADERLEVPSGEAFVVLGNLPVGESVGARGAAGPGDFAFPELRVSQSSADRHAFGHTDQIQTQAPEVALCFVKFK